MTIEEIRKGAPNGATHYLLVPNGSGEPYYLIFDKVDYYFFHSKDKFTIEYMIKYIKPL